MLSPANFDRAAQKRQLSQDEALVHLFNRAELDEREVTVLADPATHDWVAVERLVVRFEHQDGVVEHLDKLSARQARRQVATVHLPVLLGLVREGHWRSVQLLVKVDGCALRPRERVVQILVLRDVLLLAEQRLELVPCLLPEHLLALVQDVERVITVLVLLPRVAAILLLMAAVTKVQASVAATTATTTVIIVTAIVVLSPVVVVPVAVISVVVSLVSTTAVVAATAAVMMLVPGLVRVVVALPAVRLVSRPVLAALATI